MCADVSLSDLSSYIESGSGSQDEPLESLEEQADWPADLKTIEAREKNPELEPTKDDLDKDAAANGFGKFYAAFGGGREGLEACDVGAYF